MTSRQQKTVLYPKPAPDARVVMMPIKSEPRPMTGWKVGFDFQPEKSGPRKPNGGGNTSSRMRKLSKQIPKKGNFQKKNKMTAPNLAAVISAKPEMKERATAEAKARMIKMDEKKRDKMMTSRMVVSKPSPKQAKSEWTNMITTTAPAATPRKKSSPSIAHVNKKKKTAKKPAAAVAAPPATAVAASKKESSSSSTHSTATDSKPKAAAITVTNWNDVYQDIVSPTSGQHKAVAKQDLAAAEKVRSPKKKSRSLSPVLRPTSLPDTLPLDSDHHHHQMLAPPSQQDQQQQGSRSQDGGVMSLASTRIKKESQTSIKTPLSVASDLASADSRESIESLEETTELSNCHHLSGGVATESNTTLRFDQSPPKLDDDAAKGQGSFMDLTEFEDPSENPEGPESEANETPVEVASTTQDTLQYNDVIRSTEEFEKEHQKVLQVDTEQDKAVPNDTMQVASTSGVAFSDENHGKQKKLILEFSMGDGTRNGDNSIGLEVPVEVLSFDELSSVDSWPTIDSEDSYDTKMNKMMQRWVDVNGGNSNFDERLSDHDGDVYLDDNVLDHIVLAAPDLEKAMQQFEEMTGIMPTHVGPLQGLGAKTAHIALDQNRYIEILAPDEDNPGPIGDELKKLAEGTLAPYHYSIRSSEVSRLIEGYVYDVLGWDPDHIAMVQSLPDNSIRQWDLLTMYGHDMGGCAPYYVKWNDPAQHPTSSIPIHATLVACTVRAPADHDVHKLISGVGGINVQQGDPLLECTLSTPKGTLTFSAPRPKGLVFPGYDDEHQIADPMPDLLPCQETPADDDWADIGSESESTDHNI